MLTNHKVEPLRLVKRASKQIADIEDYIKRNWHGQRQYVCYKSRRTEYLRSSLGPLFTAENEGLMFGLYF